MVWINALGPLPNAVLILLLLERGLLAAIPDRVT